MKEYTLVTLRNSKNCSQHRFDFSPGRLRPMPRRARPRKGGRVWHYRWLGRYRSPKGRGLGKRLGRVTGRRKVYSCAFLAKRMRYRAFALRRGRVCYGTLSARTYTAKPRVSGRFRAGAGGWRFIDAYAIGKGKLEQRKIDVRKLSYTRSGRKHCIQSH